MFNLIMNFILRSALFIFLFLSINLVSAQGLTCSSAMAVTPGNYLASALIGTPSTPGLNGNGNTLTAGWYSFTPNSSGSISINSCGGGSDTRLWIWTGTCANLIAIANNDDFSGCYSTGSSPYASKIENITVLAGNTYFFEWDNQWEASGFSWTFSFDPLPMNNDAGISYLTNRYQRIPIVHASAGIPFGATVQNYSGGLLTNVVLTTEIYELPDTIQPIATLTSTPVQLISGTSQVISCGNWNASFSESKNLLIKYTKTQAQTDGVSANDVVYQDLILDYNYYARDNNQFETAYSWSSTNFSWKQGNVYQFLGPGSVSGVSYYVASSSTTQAYTIQIYNVLNGIPSTNPIYTSPVITANGPGWKTLSFSAPVVIAAGAQYLFVLSHSGTSGFSLGVSSATHTAGKSLIKVGSGAWNSIETYGLNAVFLMRPKFGNDPSDDIALLDNKNPGGENTQIHTRQALSGNQLNFWARAINQGTATVSGVTMTIQVKDAQNNLIYTATSAASDLLAGQIDTFIVAPFTIINLGTYSIDYIFNNPGDQIPQNNFKTTFFSRTTGQMSRTVGINGTQGLNATTIASNIVFGNNYQLNQNDVLDSVLFVLNPGTPAGYVASVKIYQTTDNGSGAMVPNSNAFANTISYTTTVADHLNGVVVKLPIAGGPINLVPGTYFFGVYQASSNIGNIRLASSTDYCSPNMVYFRWDQSNAGAWQSPSTLNYSFVVNPIFKTCLPITSTTNTSAASCGATNGGASLICSGGTGPLSYIWSNGSLASSISNVAAGLYEVTVSDANNCHQNLTVFIPNQSTLTVTATSQDVACSGQSTGSIALNVSQGTAPYNYAWSGNLGSGPNLTAIPAGTYSCTVTDAAGCVVIIEEEIVNLHTLSVASQGNQVLCHANATGVVELQVINGTAPYNFNWAGQNNTSNLISSTGPANFVCTVSDATGCSVAVPVQFTLTDLQTSINANNLTCSDDYSGSISLTTTGGLAPYAYAWSGIEIDTAALAGLAAGGYACIITDADGCSTSSAITLLAPAAWSVNAIVTPAIWGTDGAIELSVNGATGPYTYSWSNGATTEDLNNLEGNDYIVSITDASGCTYTDTITVESLVGLDAQELTQTVIYPNPSRGNVFVVGAAVEQIVMFNQMGQALAIEVQTLGKGAYEVITNNVATGSYILELRGAQDITRKALQIIK